MRLHRNNFKLLVLTTASDVGQLGAAYRIQPSADDAVSDRDQSFQLHAVLSMTASGGAQSVKVKLQTSLDKVNWLDVAETARLTDTRTEALTKDAPLGVLQTWVRAVTVVGGQVAPLHTATVWLTSDAPFRCRTE
jgi:hypothetical protein